MAQAFVPGGLRGGSPLAKVFCDIELLLKHKLQVFVNGGGVHLSKLTFQMFAFKSNSRNLLATQHKETNSVNSQPVWLSIRYRGFCLHVHPQRFLFAAQLQRPVLLTSSWGRRIASFISLTQSVAECLSSLIAAKRKKNKSRAALGAIQRGLFVSLFVCFLNGVHAGSDFWLTWSTPGPIFCNEVHEGSEFFFMRSTRGPIFCNEFHAVSRFFVTRSRRCPIREELANSTKSSPTTREQWSKVDTTQFFKVVIFSKSVWRPKMFWRQTFVWLPWISFPELVPNNN